MRKCAIAGAVAALVLPLSATTLQQLSLSDLAQQSTSIVRGTLQPSYTALRGSVIYAHYTLQVTEVWKGGGGSQTLDVAVPGGVLKGVHQTYSGAPAFTPRQDYVLFLWTGRSGLTQVMGLSQGLFNINMVSGVPMVTRAASSENVLGQGGQAISDTNFSMSLTSFRANVNQTLGVMGVAN
jgi:hypothetical protein